MENLASCAPYQNSPHCRIGCNRAPKIVAFFLLFGCKSAKNFDVRLQPVFPFFTRILSLFGQVHVSIKRAILPENLESYLMQRYLLSRKCLYILWLPFCMSLKFSLKTRMNAFRLPNLFNQIQPGAFI